ncbi:glycoprotein endopeptidase metalloprotease [Nitrospira sp. KM1]|uniref:ABC transporter permease n=1 Tax=Nitrospira sp. KM1 TaxID=1936990 RepID=UPI0013A7787F|nr:MlaE family lipid ABC transporter permease subunit [Nitrospira sp. KM1]BCA54558.1 glycoprotein endopeptidase metalloprotease [Nitrospira sp. KM1]
MRSVETAQGVLRTHASSHDDLVFSITGPLDARTTGQAWRTALERLTASNPSKLIIDARGLTYCDGAGAALLLELRRRQQLRKGTFEIRSLDAGCRALIDLYGPKGEERPDPPSPVESIFEQIGRATVTLAQDTMALIAFVGELCVAMGRACRHPGLVRWSDAFWTAELVGVNALPIVALLGFLLGLIMAFQAAIPMRQFGADIYVANLIGLSMLRELGPLLTAIILAGRSGSAFAAELGTMKVSEEIDALTTMGLEPVGFLVVPRVIAAVAMTPLLAVWAAFLGLVGGAVVMRSLGFPLVTYVIQVTSAVTIGDMVGGLCKAFVFGIVVAAVGCLRGLQTRSGASAVGESTTSAVVSGLVLITIVDGVFAVVFYYLDL